VDDPRIEVPVGLLASLSTATAGLAFAGATRVLLAGTVALRFAAACPVVVRQGLDAAAAE
jgi:hypothetical protein